MQLDKNERYIVEKLKEYDKYLGLNKKRISLTLNRKVLAEAKKKKINISKFLEEKLKQTLKI